ncbi:MAG: questin oxidase family protein [Rubrivivax sp.]|nr:questin oxidase family protein [Rubrivivax sp.]
MTRAATVQGAAAALDAVAGFDAEYGDGLSSHLPMAVLALQRLGAPAARVQVFARGYAARLPPAAPPQAWPADTDWTARLGDRAAWPAYRELFARRLRREGTDTLLAALLPRLMPGCGGAAFHGLIRAGYAVQADHPGELADALAYWASRWADLGPLPALTATESDPAAVLRQLPLPAQPPAGRLIADRVAGVAALPGFADAVARLRVDAQTLERLARGSAEMYAASGNFTVLHMLTSAHALRVLLPWLADPVGAVRHYWQAFAAAWVASGARPAAPAPLRPWRPIVAFALASDDEHVVKLVDSCREQSQAYGGEVWRRAASRVLATG